MKKFDGRWLGDRRDLAERSGLSVQMLSHLWVRRPSNGHPEAVELDGRLHWALLVWDAWYEGLREQMRDIGAIGATLPIGPVDDLGGGADDQLLDPDQQEQFCGLSKGTVRRYQQQPPPAWPAPTREETLRSGRAREYRTRRQLLAYLNDPRRELDPGEQEEFLGLSKGAVKRYRHTPPAAWPTPAREEVLRSGRVREYRTLGDLLDYLASPQRLGRSRAGRAGRKPGPQPPRKAHPYEGHPALETAAQAIAAAPPGTSDHALARALADRHGQSVSTWTRRIKAARSRADPGPPPSM